MAILDFQKPDKVIMNEANDFVGNFEFRPLEPGYGVTIGNALRRTLLNSLEGFAITKVRIEGVEQEFTSIDGIMEDVTDIILNLKQLRLKQQIEDQYEEKINVVISNQKEFTGKDINTFLSNFQVINSDQLICRMESSVKLNMEVTIGKGRGYRPAEENKSSSDPLGTIVMDSIFTPIVNVKYDVENYRVEQKTDYEKLLITIEGDGSVHPKDALKEAAKILIKHFMLFSDERITLDEEEPSITEEFDETSLHMRQLLKTSLGDVDLSVRALNCLKAAEVETLGDLVSYNRNDLLKFRNFGKKSLSELEDLVRAKGLTFGMDVSKYKLDKD